MRRLKFHRRATNHPENDANEVREIKVHFRLRHKRAAPLFRVEGTNRNLRTFFHISEQFHVFLDLLSQTFTSNVFF